MRDVFRQLWNAIGWGAITSVNDAGPAQLAQVGFGQSRNGAIRDNVPVVQLFGLASNPPLGSDATLLFFGGDPSNGVIIGTGHQATRYVGQASGETTLYNSGGIRISLTQGGIVIDAQNLPITINNGTTITANAVLLRCTGDIIDNYLTQPNNMREMRTIYDGHTHPVHNVQSGGATVNTDVPTQLE